MKRWRLATTGAPIGGASVPGAVVGGVLGLIARRPAAREGPEIPRRWTPVLTQLGKELGIPVKPTMATDYRGTIEALKFKKAEVGWFGAKAYVEATTNNYANVEPIAQVQSTNGSLGYRSCLIVHQDFDVFSPEDMAGKTFAFNDPHSTSGYGGDHEAEHAP
jgi:phosphate/phosphite/phosphonate ABC transporter binding protein